MVNWAKDRDRALKRRAVAEEHDEWQRKRAASHMPKVQIFQEKTKLRVLGEKAVRQFEKDKSEKTKEVPKVSENYTTILKKSDDDLSEIQRYLMSQHSGQKHQSPEPELVQTPSEKTNTVSNPVIKEKPNFYDIHSKIPLFMIFELSKK